MFENKNILLYPVSLLYGLATGIRNFLYNTGIIRTTSFDFPIICVGNIAIGGTGKTPHTEYLIRLLGKQFNVAVLSRGYMRKTRDFIIASSSSTVSEIGDEPLQIMRKFPEATMAVDRDRVNGVKMILKNRAETDVIIMDDGFQHRRIAPGLSILLTDFHRLIVRDHLLPYGNLRESTGNMRRADIIIVTKTPQTVSAIERRLIAKEINKTPYQSLYFTSYKYGLPVPVFEGTGKFISGQLTGAGVILITGIANPRPFLDYISDLTHEVIHLPFPDHYNFEEKDFERFAFAFDSLESPVRYLITTEKDSVRLREFSNIAERLKSAFFYIPVEINFLNDGRDEFDNRILEYVRKDRRNNTISEKPGN